MRNSRTNCSQATRLPRQKAGIFKPGVPVVVDGTNDAEALRVVERVLELGRCEGRCLVALEALAIASRSLPGVTPETAVRCIEATRWLGRLDWRGLSSIAPALNGANILLDGALNLQAAYELAAYVDGLRHNDGVNWVIAANRGKNMEKILRIILRPSDKVASTECLGEGSRDTEHCMGSESCFERGGTLAYLVGRIPRHLRDAMETNGSHIYLTALQGPSIIAKEEFLIQRYRDRVLVPSLP
ncbi:hypothetical protein BDZ91DRAFT_781941 [Kalaharituber pfeilii]|nr:hypothetical protein BDZ91DRAFT_781941 [Kalaharituber pfeilii]